MTFRRCLILVLVAGFWLSFQGRLEPHFDSLHTSLAFHVANVTHEHEDSSRAPAAPRGDHKDQHGCYHSHAPFMAVETSFASLAPTSMLVLGVADIPNSLALTNILRPPRA